MSGDLTPEAEVKIDLKLAKLKKEIQDEMTKEQKPYNNMIREMHQEMMGYAERKGLIGQLQQHENRIENHDGRIKRLEDNTVDKIETKKVLGMIAASVLGGGGIITALVLFLIGVIK